MQLDLGSTRLRRVVCGVSPQTSSYHFAELNSGIDSGYEADGETPSAARETPIVFGMEIAGWGFQDGV